MTEAINIRFNGESNFAMVNKDVAALRAQFALLQKDALTAANVGNGNVRGYENVSRSLVGLREQFKLGTLAAGEYSVIQQKLVPQSVLFAERLKQQKVGMMELIGSHKMMNTVLKEQIALQHAASLSWSTDSTGRVSSDLIIPKNLPANLVTMRQKMGLWNSALSSVSQNTLNWGKNTQWAGRQLMTGLSLPLGILAGATMKFAFDIDKELTAVTKVYGDVTTGFVESNDLIRKNAMSTVKTAAALYGQSAKDTLGLMAAFAAAGKTGAELQQTTIATSKIALAGELSWQEASAATITLQSVYHHNAQQLGEDYAYINAMENQTVLTSQDFLTAIPKVVGVMNAMGASLRDVGTLLTAMKAGGIDAANGANALKTIDFRLLATYSKGLKTFKQNTGQDLQEMVASTNGDIIPTLMKFGNAIKDLTKVQQVAVVKDVFGIYQGSKVFTVIQQLLTGSEQMKQAFAVANNSAADNAAIMRQELLTVANQPYQKIKVAWESIQITLSEIGAKLLPIGATIIAAVGKIISGFEGLGDGTKKWLMITGAVVGLAGPIIMLTGLFANLLGNVGRMITSLGSLALKFKYTDAEDRARALLSKQAANGWDMQTASVAKLTLSLQELSAAKRAEFAELNPASVLPQWSTMTRANNYGTPRPARVTEPGAVTLNPAVVPTKEMGLVTQDTKTGKYRVGGSFATEQQAVAATQARVDANYAILRSEELQGQTLARNAVEERGMVQTESYRLNAIREQNLLLEKQAAEQAATLRTRTMAVGGGLMAAGMLGSMISSTDSLTYKISNAMMMLSMLGMMMPGISSKVISGIASMGGKMGGAIGKGAALAKTGIMAMGTALAPILPAIAAIAITGGLLWKQLADAEAEATARAKDYGQTTQGMADVLGFSYQEISPTNKNAVISQLQAVAQETAKFTAAHPLAANVFWSMFDVKDKTAKTMGERWGIAIAEGAAVKLHGGTAEAAREATRVAMKLMGQNFDSADFKVKIDAQINFDDANAVMDANIAGITSKFQQALNDAGSGAEKFWRDHLFGQGDITSWAAQQTKDVARELSAAIDTATPRGAPKVFDQFFGNIQKPLNDLLTKEFSRIVKTPRGQDLMKNYGFDSAKSFAEGFNNLSTSDKNSFNNPLIGFTPKDAETIQKLNDGMVMLIQQTLELRNMPVPDAEKITTIDGFKKGLGSALDYKNQLISVSQAEKNYQIDLATYPDARHKLTEAMKLQILNNERFAAGLPKTTELLDGFNIVERDTATGAVTAAGATQMLTDKLKELGITGIDAAAAIATQKSVITGTISDISTIANSGLDALASARLDAVQKSGAAALASLDAKTTALDASQTKQTEKHTALWDARKKAINDAIKVEQNAETIRQKIFDAEKTRISRMADMYGKNIDMNMAINSGNLDTAAKIQNDMISTQQGWDTGAAADASKTASDAKVAALQLQLDGIDKAQKADDKALKSSQDNIKKKVDAEKKAQEEINKNNEKAVQARSAANKAGFAADLAVLTAFVPATKKQMNDQIASIQALYKKYGEGTLVPQGQKWGDIIAKSLKTNMEKTANATASSKAWETAGTDIVDSLLKGGFNMSPAEFAAWLNGGPLPKTAFQTPKPITMTAKMIAAKDTKYANSGFATGGPIHGAGTGTSDSIPTWLSHGEYVINAKQTAKFRPLLDSINYAKGYASGGQVSGIGGVGSVPMMGMYGAMKGVINDVLNAAAVRGANRDALVLAAGASTPTKVSQPKSGGPSGASVGTQVFAPGTGVARWSNMVLQALAMLGQPSSLLNTTLRRMNQESGGNPNAINLWDSNAMKGIPSKGLMQTIDPTFNHYRLPSLSSNVYDPLSNIVASMRYAISRYGSLSNAYNRAGGYAGGGLVMPQLKTGGVTLNDGYARLHQAETVLTAPLSQQLNEGIGKLANGPVNSYTIKADFNGAHFSSDVDIERAFQNLMDKAERRNGPNRKIGS